MAPGNFRFDRFELDPANRQLRRDGAPVELNARYLDALMLMLREPGRLVSKARFHDEVWRGIPVTDEALTQCIRTLRRQLGDDAARPRFIETVPKHGYRFIAPVEQADLPAAPQPVPANGGDWPSVLLLGSAGTVGGGVAGVIGGLIYGFGAASQPLAPGMGAVSVLLVLLSLTILVALMGAGGVSFGIALARRGGQPRLHQHLLGGAAGGLAVGALVKLLGIDAFNLLFGSAPGGITGAMEGALIGAAVGLAAWLAFRRSGTGSLRRGVAVAGLAGAGAGVLIGLLGGRMMAGSLDLLASHFPDSRLRLGQLGALVGEPGFGPLSRVVTGALEGALFGACVVGAMLLARRQMGQE